MKKALLLLAAALLLPISQVWAGSYYAKLVVGVANNSPTGSGTVYASDSSKATSGDASITKDGGSSGASVTLYAYSTPADGYELVGWSDKADGSSIIGDSKKNPFAATYTCGGQNQTITYNRYAVFQEITYPDFVITYSAPVNGSYTVDGTSVGSGGLSSGTKTKIYKPTLVATASGGYAFNGWYQDGSKVSSSTTYTPTYTASHTVSPQFVQATVVTTLDALKTSVQGNPLTEVPSGTAIVIPKDETVTVGTDKTLIVNGTIWVEGTFNGSAGSVTVGGAVRKVVKSITQSEPIVPANAYATYPSYKYCTTQISSVTSAMVSGCTTSYGVLVGGKHYAIDAADPNALKVTFDTIKAVNSISSVENATVSGITANGSYLLLKDTTISGPTVEEKGGSSTYTRYAFNGTIDLAGKKCTVSNNKQVGASFKARLVNGSFDHAPSGSKSSCYWQCGTVWAMNCSSLTIRYVKYNLGNDFYFYDCGTQSAPMSLSFTFYDSTRTSNNRNAYFYSGVCNYAFNATDDKGYSQVFGGLYKNDPSAYLGDTKLIAKQSGDHDNYYLVRQKLPTDDVVKIGDTGYTSLQAAIDAATTGARLKVNNTIALTGKVSIPSGKNLIIDLNGINISGGSIENAGTLRLEDTSTVQTKGTLSTPVANTGTIDITYGTYANTFTMNGGTLVAHGGTFTDVFGIVKNAGNAYLRGGTFNGTLPVALEEGYRKVGAKVGKYFEGYMNQKSVGSAQIGYQVKMLAPLEDYNLYKKYLEGSITRDKYDSNDEWDHLAELVSAISPYENMRFDCTLSFDRDVAANTISGYGEVYGSAQERVLDVDLPAGSLYRMLRPIFVERGAGDKAYKYFFTESAMQSIACGVANKSTAEALANIGTTCTIGMRLFDGDALVLNIGSRSYKFAGKGAIAGSTDYASLQAALTAAGYAGTVRLSKDCSETITVSATKTFVVDKNNFNFTGSVNGGTGYSATPTDLGDGKTQYAVTPVPYAITYELNGGTNHPDNPKTYTIESAAITLKAPTRAGHFFTGWAEGGTIPSGSTGAKTFTATWKKSAGFYLK